MREDTERSLHGVGAARERELADAGGRADDREAGAADAFAADHAFGGVIASRLLSAKIGLSFQRMFLTGRVTLPFSIRNRPSRVRPVTSSVCGSSERMYQKRVTRTPRSTPLIRSSIVAVPPSMIRLPGCGVGSLPCFCAQ